MTLKHAKHVYRVMPMPEPGLPPPLPYGPPAPIDYRVRLPFWITFGVAVAGIGFAYMAFEIGKDTEWRRHKSIHETAAAELRLKDRLERLEELSRRRAPSRGQDL